MSANQTEQTPEEAGRQILEMLNSLEHDLENMRQMREKALEPGPEKYKLFAPETIKMLTGPRMAKAIETTERSKEAFAGIRKMAEMLMNEKSNPTIPKEE
jgi:hypothetical protein